MSMIGEDVVKSYLKALGRVPLLTAEEEIELGRQVQAMLPLLDIPVGDRTAEQHVTIAQGQQARTKMITANLRLVVHVAKKYQAQGLDFLDLVQEGSIGLARSVERFDPGKGFKFGTYAHWWIRQAITRAIADQARAIRLPVHAHGILNKLKWITQPLSQRLGRRPTPAELAAELNCSEKQVRFLLETNYQQRLPLSLDIEIGDETSTALVNLLAAPNDEQVERQSTQEALLALMGSCLTHREYSVISARYGLEGPPQSLDAIGKVAGISRERVRQIERKAMTKLKCHAARSLLDAIA